MLVKLQLSPLCECPSPAKSLNFIRGGLLNGLKYPWFGSVNVLNGMQKKAGVCRVLFPSYSLRRSVKVSDFYSGFWYGYVIMCHHSVGYIPDFHISQQSTCQLEGMSPTCLEMAFQKQTLKGEL